MLKMKLTKEEKQVIEQLQKLAETWPKSLWLFSASGSLLVMKVGKDGKPVFKYNGGADLDYIVTTIDIPNDGGDW
jgi:hypothetical protein